MTALFENDQVTGLILKDGTKIRVVPGSYKEFLFKKDPASEVYSAKLELGNYVDEMICGPTVHIMAVFYRSPKWNSTT